MTTTQITPQQQQVSDWFENLIADIRVDQVQIEAGVADTDKTQFYQSLISGKEDEVFKKIRFEASQLLIERVIKSFIAESRLVDAELTKSTLHKKTIAAFETLQPLINFINRTIENA